MGVVCRGTLAVLLLLVVGLYATRSGRAQQYATTVDCVLGYKRVPSVPSNKAFQPRRCASLAYRDRAHFDSRGDLLMLFPRSARLNARPLGGGPSTVRLFTTHLLCAIFHTSCNVVPYPMHP